MSRSLLIVAIIALFGSLASATTAVAQEGAGQQPGITTTGYGEASAPADSVSLQFLISNQDSFYGGPPLAPQVEATPGAEAQATVAPIADAISGHDGVESVEVVVPLITNPYSGPPSLARIDVTVTSPDQDGLASLVNVVVQTAAAERLLVSYVGARFEAEDCHALEEAARQAALDDARGRAGIQAGLLEVELGDVIASTDVDVANQGINLYGQPTTPQSNCDPEISQVFNVATAANLTLPSFDPTVHSGEVEIYRQVQVTFAMAAGEATPAA